MKWLGAVAIVLLAACDLHVTNPGPLADEQLDTPNAMPALVNGMGGDLSVALGNYVDRAALASGELTHSGNFVTEAAFYRGIITPADANVDWANMQDARWVAEQGLVRMKRVLGAAFETHVDTPRAYLYGGFANRLLGENVCSAVIDLGAAQSDTVHFVRAESLFTRAYTLATALKNTNVATAALAGRASVRAWQGNWSGAVTDAAQVPAAFRYDAIFGTGTPRENLDIANQTITRRETTVWGTVYANTRSDPRTTWDTVKTTGNRVQTGQDGRTNFFRQTKYKTLGDPVALAKGTEMLLLRAEAALRDGDVANAVALMNQARTTAGLTALSPAPTTVAAAWTVLEAERGATLWLEGRRLWDLRRWNADPGPAHNTFLDGRSKCVPISDNEKAANPNVR